MYVQITPLGSKKKSFISEIFCPGDSSCSNQGTCDDNSGICICNPGFEGNLCQSNFKYMW